MEQNVARPDGQEKWSYVFSVVGVILVVYGILGAFSTKTIWYVTLLFLLIAQLLKLWSTTIGRWGKINAWILLGIALFLAYMIRFVLH